MKYSILSEQRTRTGARTTAVCAGLVLLGSPAVLAQGNHIELGVGAASVDDNDAAYQRRHQNNGDVFGGIESFRFEQITEGGIFLLEGRAMFGLDDYLLRLRYDADDIGYVEAGYREFRTWYKYGSGGYAGPGVAPPDDWIVLGDDELHLDRGEVWFEAGLRMPDIPQITFRYEHRWRDGQKDSTSWGRGVRGNIPSYYDLDETSDIFILDVLHNVGNTAVGAGLRYQMVDNSDTRNMNQGAGNANPASDRKVAQTDDYEADLFSAHLFTETHFGDKAILSFGYNFTTMDTDIGGLRPSVDRDGVLRTSDDHSYWGLMGGTSTSINTVSANLWIQAAENLVVIPSLRAEWWEQDGWGWHVAGIRNREDLTQAEVDAALAGTWPQTGSDAVADLEEVLDRSAWEWEQFNEAIEVRYDGIDNLLAFAKAEFVQVDTDRSQSSTIDDYVDPTEIDTRTGDSDTDMQKYTLGANWYAAPGLSFSIQGYHKNYEQDFDNVVDGEDAQLKQHNYETNDFNLRMTWRAASCLTLVSRYDYQETTIENQAYSTINDDPTETVLTPLIDAADITRHIFSQSATWTPREWMYLQGSLHYIDSKTDTGADFLTGAGGLAYAPDWDTESWLVSLNAGFALDEQTDLLLGYFYYEADNFVNNSTIGAPLGTDATEHALTARLTRRINPSMVWNIGYGYFTGEDDAYGGFNDYDAHVVSTGFRYSF